METLEKNDIKGRIKKVILIILLLLVFFVICVSLYYNYTLQQQVNERDVLIEKLTKHDSILNQLMEFKYDSTTGSTSYSYLVKEGKVIKYNSLVAELDKSRDEYNQISEKHKKIIEENNQNINDYNALIKSFNSLNKDRNELIDKYNILVNRYNDEIRNHKEIINKYNLIVDSLSSFKTIVRLSQSHFGIKYSINRNGNVKHIEIQSEKLDSALILLPYFRDRLRLDKEKNLWIITTDKKEKK